MKIISDTELQKKIGWKPTPLQQEIINASKTKRDIVVCAGRQAGKSMCVAYVILRTLLADNQEILVCSASYELTNRVLDHLKVWLNRGFPSSPQFQTRPFPKIVMPWGSYCEGKSTDAPSQILGKAYTLVVVDESALIPRRIYEQYVYPATTTKQARSIFISTPRGKNWFYEKWLDAKESPEGQEFHFTSKDNPFFKQEEWDRARAKMPADVFEQEFLSVFMESSASVFRGVRDIIHNDYPKEAEQGHHYILGVDLGKHRDFTVLTVLDRESRKVVFWDRFNQLEYPFQKKRIVWTANRYNNARIIIDSSNIGDPIQEDLKRDGLYVDDFKFTNKSKKELIEKLSIIVEQKEVFIPNEIILIDEMECFGYTMSEHGNIIYNALTGHDDAVISLALAVWGLQPIVKAQKNAFQERLREENFKKRIRPSFI